MKEKFKIKKAQAGVDNTYVRKPYSLLELEKNKKKQIEEEYKKKQTQLKPKKENKINRDFYEKENQSREANDNINRRQQQTNTLGLALSPIPVFGEIYNTANTIANGVVDVAQGEYADVAASLIPFGISKYRPKVRTKDWNTLDSPKGNLYGEYQTIVQQQRLLNPEIKKKFFEHQASIENKTSNMFAKPRKDIDNRITTENYKDFVNDIHNKTEYDLSSVAGKQPYNLGVGNYGKSGMVFKDAPLNPLQKDIINAHEKNHGIFAGTLSDDMRKGLMSPFGGIGNKAVKGYKDSAQADEVLARMGQFKNAVGISDNQPFTLGHLNLIRSNYANKFIDNGISDMLSKIPVGSKAEKLFLENMNKYAFGAAGVGAMGISQQKQFGGEANMEQDVVSAYIQQAGLDQTQAQQLMQELQALDETQLQQVLGKMQQQLQSAPMQQAPQQMEEEMMMQYGGIPVDENGVFATGKNPVVVPTRGTGKISMEGVDFPIDSYDADTMEYLETMQPNQEYQFDGVNNVLEIPQAKFGIQKMQTGGNIAMDNNRLMEYEYELNEDESPLGKKYQKKLDETFDALATDKLNVKEYFKQKEKLIQEYLANKHKNDKPVNYLNSPKKFPVKVRDFKSTPASNPTSAISTPNYSGNSPVEAIGNPNLRVGDRVDTVGGTPVRDFGITNKNPSRTGEYDFISQLQGKTNRAENIGDYVSWKNEWSDMIPNFESKPYAEQQKLAMEWVKTNKPNIYQDLKTKWEAAGYKKGNSFEGYLKDGMYANITSSLRPSLLNDRVAPIAPIERKPTGLNTKIPTTLPLADIQKKVIAPTIEDDSINPADAIIGKLDNRDMSGRYLSNMKLRNNEIKLPYFQQVDLKTPQLYQQDITPYINNLYTGYNAAVQNIDMNSAVGQAQALQLNANLDKSINDVSGSVYNQNLKAAIDWENQLTGIYNQQSQLDNQNRAAYSDGVDLVRTNKQNVDNQIDALAYEHKMNQIQNKNKMTLSTLLHPDFYTTDEGNGQMVLKRKYNKAPTANSTPTTTNPSIEAERDFWKDLALKNSKTKVAKYGIGKKKTMC